LSEEDVSVSYWHFNKGFGNFGDELNVPIAKFLFGDAVKFNSQDACKKIRLIGSILGDIKKGDIVCGVGLHHHSQVVPNSDNQFRCVRGPLSLKCARASGVDTSNVFMGDPALLLSMFYKPTRIQGLEEKIGVVPHISNIDLFKNLTEDDDRFYLIDPTEKWEDVINKIYSCSAVVSSSLHGLICSDTFNVPNVWIKIPGMSIPPCGKDSDDGDFKYWDYFMSQGREINYVNSIFDNLEDKMYRDGNTIDLDKLTESITGIKKSKKARQDLGQNNTKKIIFLQHNLFEEDFILELFEGMECEKVFDIEMKSPQQDSVIVYSDIYAKNVNVYPEKHRKFLRERFEKIAQYFQKCKNCILIHLSDEHCHANIDHYKNFKHIFRQYYRSDAVADNVTFIPLGYKKGFHDE
jgi:pyruvyltransferase